MNFGTITLNPGMVTGQNCYMDTDSFVIYVETEDFQTLQVMLKDGLIHLTMMKMIKNFSQQVKTKEYQDFLKMNQGERL